MIDKLLAKSDGTTLIEHSIKVSEFIIQVSNKLGVSENKIPKLVTIALLHDIGKCTNQFQLFLKNPKEKNTEDNKKKFPFLHQEIAYAFLCRYTDLDDDILYSIYWHHGLINAPNSHYCDQILDKISPDEIDLMKAFLVYFKINIVDNQRNPKTPKYYNFENIHHTYDKQILLFCLVSADRIDHENIENIDKVFSKNPVLEIPSPYQNERFKHQQQIASIEGKVKQINAPAGYGKTILGLLSFFKTNKKIVWICPRNYVAITVYESVLAELEKLGVTMSVELYYNSEVVKSNHDTHGFTSDLIITNIDNFLNPVIQADHRISMIMACDVIFDEYHELVGDAALFCCFLNTMNIRQKLQNKTILLSATPYSLDYQWSSLNNPTIILPSPYAHYNPIHDKKYFFNITDDDFGDIPENSSSLVITNSVKKAQERRKNSNGILIHSHFSESYKKETYNVIIKHYSKNSEKSKNKPNVFGTNIIQAGLDVSFCNLFEYVLSPEATIQRIGRINRFGELEIAYITISKGNFGSENKIRENLYSKELTQLWFQFLKENFHNKYLTLNEIYTLCNVFNEKYKEKIKSFINFKIRESRENLEDIYPIKFPNRTKTEVKRAGSNRLRASGNELFITCKNHLGEYIDPISINVYNLPRFKNVNERVLINQMKSCDKFDNYKDFLEKIKYSNNAYNIINELGKYSDSPFIRDDYYYDPILGLEEKA